MYTTMYFILLDFSKFAALKQRLIDDVDSVLGSFAVLYIYFSFVDIIS